MKIIRPAINNVAFHIRFPLRIARVDQNVQGGANKFLAQPGRKDATMTKLGIYSTSSPRSSIHFLARCSNFCKPLKEKLQNVVRLIRSPRQKWLMAKDLSAPRYFNIRCARMWTNLVGRLCASHVRPCTCDLVSASLQLGRLSSASVAYRGGRGALGVQTPPPPPEIPKALQNRAKLNPIVKNVKNCWI